MTPPVSRPVSRPTAGPAVQVVGGQDPALASLLDEWDGLQRRLPASSPFQSAAWLGAYCRSYGGADVETVAVRDGDELDGAAAFTRSRRGAATVLRSAPAQVSDFEDVVLGEGEGSPSRLVQGLLAVPGWDAVDFQEVPPSADLWRVLPHWPGTVLRLPSSECVVLDGEDLDAYAAGLPTPKRKRLGQQRRGVARAGVTAVRAEGDPEAAVRTLLEIHCASWADRGMNPEHATERFRDLLVQAVQELAPRRQAAVVHFHHDGRVQGAALYLAGPQYVGIYLNGHHPVLREQVNLHVMEMVAGFDLVADAGLRQLHMFRGVEEYKVRLPARHERSERVVLVRPGSVAGRAFALGVAGRRSAADAVRAGRRRLAARRPSG
jgi:CelD/BcsL family acetyltransferase involved in cellulose biosynthesis